MERDQRRYFTGLLIVIIAMLPMACAVLPEDVRASLPEPLRGDTKALKDYPTPQLAGNWTDIDYPSMTIDLRQQGERFTIKRSGDYRGIPIDETYQGTLEGRAIKVTFSSVDQGQIRPIKGRCRGVASKDSSRIELTCENSQKGTVPFTLTKR